MAKYIDADKIKYYEHTVCCGHGDFRPVRTVSEEEIKAIPAADVVEVRHGEWEILLTAIIDTIGKCTNCGGEAVWRTRLKPYTLCPHCGAKMDGGGEG